jgi:hypothetical protein
MNAPDTCAHRDLTRLAFSVINDAPGVLSILGETPPHSDVAEMEYAAAVRRADSDTVWAHEERVTSMASAMARICVVAEMDSGEITDPAERTFVLDRYQEYFKTFGVAMLGILAEDDVLAVA